MPKNQKPDTIIKAEEINAVLLTARAISLDPTTQVGAVGLAFVTLCKSYGLDKAEGLRRMRHAFNTPMETGSLDAAAPRN